MICVSVSQPFLARGTLNVRQNLATHLYLEIFEKVLEKELYFTNWKQNFLIFTIKVRLTKMAAHLGGVHGTLVCRGAPVEKHCVRD